MQDLGLKQKMFYICTVHWFSKFHDENCQVICWVYHFAFGNKKKIGWSPNPYHVSSTTVFLPDETKYCWYYSYSCGSQKTTFGEKWNDGKMEKHSFGRVRSLGQEFWMLSWLNALFCTFLLLPSFFHFVNNHYHPPSCLGQKPRSYACFSLLPPIQDTSKMYFKCICFSLFP